MGEFVVITGQSGAGRSLAADDLEDLGWFVIDNLPPELVPKVVELAQTPGSRVDRVALVVGTGHYQDEILPTLAWLRSTGARVRVLFLEATTDTLVRRYESSRRRHPLSRGGNHEHLVAAIERERLLLDPVRDESDVVLDTTALNVHELRRRMRALFGGDDAAPDDADDAAVVRLQERAAARRRPGVRLPLPAQPPLGGRAAAADRARRPGPRLCPGPTGGGRLPRQPGDHARASSCRPTWPRARHT